MADPSLPEALPLEPEPTREITPIGAAADAPIGIYVSREVVRFIEAFVRANPNKESGGVLLGYAARSERRPFLRITGAVEAHKTDVVNGGIRFTDAAWHYMDEVCRREYPGTTRLGWFVSHPGQGAHLTGYDQFTHHRFFDRPWQVSFVIDPIREASRFFAWRGNRLAAVDAFYVWDAGKDAMVQPVGVATRAAARPARRPRLRGRLVPALLILLASVLLVASLPRAVHYMPWIGPTLRQAAHTLQEIHIGLETAAQTNKALHEAMAVQANRTAGPIPVALPVLAEANDQASELGSASSTPDPDLTLQLAPPVETTTIGPSPTPPPMEADYTVQEGDTLWHISRSLLGDATAYSRLAEWNGIQNPDTIHPGLSLRVPSEKAPPPSDPPND